MATKKIIKKSDATLHTVIKKLNVHDERFDCLEKQMDSVIRTVADHSEQLRDIKSQTKKLDMFDDLMAGQDKMIAILERVDQERLFTHEAVKRLEVEVVRIKKHLHLV